MIFSVLVIFAVFGIAYMWGSRGAFSALIHLLCTIVAGAIAFAAWEPLTSVFMNVGGDMIGWAHGLALAVPFAVSLIVLRLATNAIIPKNIDLDGITNMVGGGLCGAIAGVITAGIFVLSIGYLRLESTIMGFEPVTYSNNGSLVRTSHLLLPADQFTSTFYSVMSDSTFRTDENLAKWHPDLQDEGPLLRLNFDDGKSRHAIPKSAFEVLNHYTVEPGKDLLNDTFEPGKKRQFTYIDNSQPNPAQSTIEGYVVKFNPGANEKTGRVIVGNGQLRLVVQTADGGSMAIQPVAVISEGESSKSEYGRWCFDGQKTFIATVGGRNESPMAFEFVVPKGAQPLGLYVKGTRVDVRGMKPYTTFASIQARDAAARDGQLNIASKAEPVDAAGAVQKKPTQLENWMLASDRLQGGLVFQRDDLQGLTINDEKQLLEGEGKFRKDSLRAREGDPALQVRRLACPEDQVVVQVVVDGRNSDWGFLSNVGAGIDLEKGPRLVDDSGVPYTPFGFIYETQKEVWVTLRPSNPITHVNEMPLLTRSQPDQKLTLLFRVGRERKIKYFAVGGKALLVIEPPFATSNR